MAKEYVIGTVEHRPEIDYAQEILQGMDVKKVVLRPLMVVADNHANNDMAGDEENSYLRRMATRAKPFLKA